MCIIIVIILNKGIIRESASVSRYKGAIVIALFLERRFKPSETEITSYRKSRLLIIMLLFFS